MCPQCRCNRSTDSLHRSSADEVIPESFLGIPDSLIKKLPILPDDYFMKESNIMNEEGYELDPKEVIKVLQQCKGVIISLDDDIISFKRGEGNSRVFLLGKWSASNAVDYYILKCITDEKTNEVFIFSIIGNSINDSEWIAAIDMDSDSETNSVSVFINDDYDIKDDYDLGQIKSRKEKDTVFVCFFDVQQNLQEEHKCVLTKEGEIIFSDRD